MLISETDPRLAHLGGEPLGATATPASPTASGAALVDTREDVADPNLGVRDLQLAQIRDRQYAAAARKRDERSRALRRSAR